MFRKGQTVDLSAPAAIEEPADPDEMRSGQNRLAEMAIANTREALGEKWTRIAQHKLDDGRDMHIFQSYGGGRLAPHEWVRNSDAGIFKVDSSGHDADHTLIGKQSVVWDLAGLVLEWNLHQQQTAELHAVCSAKAFASSRPFSSFTKSLTTLSAWACATSVARKRRIPSKRPASPQAKKTTATSSCTH
jgi:hypothetical protein